MNADIFNRALHFLAPGFSHERIARDLFASRISRSGIRHWRAGRRGLPQWAIDTIRAKLRQQAQIQLQIAAELRPGIGHRIGGARALRQWRAKRAKEKGAAMGALVESESGTIKA